MKVWSGEGSIELEDRRFDEEEGCSEEKNIRKKRATSGHHEHKAICNVFH
jgi:hypothetical protein